MKWYLKVLKNYAVFAGRARRKEYWFFVLFNILIFMVLSLVEHFMGLVEAGAYYGPISGLYNLAVLIPSIAVTVRRLHDTGKSGWWILLNLIPIVGAVVIIVFMVIDSDEAANEYGPNPKLEPEPEAAF